MKTLIVETGDSTETYEMGDKATIILEGGNMICDDYVGSVVVYAPGRFISAHLETVTEI